MIKTNLISNENNQIIGNIIKCNLLDISKITTLQTISDNELSELLKLAKNK